MSVLTFAHCTSYIDFTASFIFCFVARMSTRNTRVLISSIFFIADSVVSGLLMIANLSNLSKRLTDFEGYFGSRFLMSVLGLKKWMLRRFFDDFRDTVCLIAFATLPAFLLPPLTSERGFSSEVAAAFGAPFFGAISINHNSTRNPNHTAVGSRFSPNNLSRSLA